MKAYSKKDGLSQKELFTQCIQSRFVYSDGQIKFYKDSTDVFLRLKSIHPWTEKLATAPSLSHFALCLSQFFRRQLFAQPDFEKLIPKSKKEHSDEVYHYVLNLYLNLGTLPPGLKLKDLNLENPAKGKADFFKDKKYRYAVKYIHATPNARLNRYLDALFNPLTTPFASELFDKKNCICMVKLSSLRAFSSMVVESSLKKIVFDEANRFQSSFAKQFSPLFDLDTPLLDYFLKIQIAKMFTPKFEQEILSVCKGNPALQESMLKDARNARPIEAYIEEALPKNLSVEGTDSEFAIRLKTLCLDKEIPIAVIVEKGRSFIRNELQNIIFDTLCKEVTNALMQRTIQRVSDALEIPPDQRCDTLSSTSTTASDDSEEKSLTHPLSLPLEPTTSEEIKTKKILSPRKRLELFSSQRVLKYLPTHDKEEATASPPSTSTGFKHHVPLPASPEEFHSPGLFLSLQKTKSFSEDKPKKSSESKGFRFRSKSDVHHRTRGHKHRTKSLRSMKNNDAIYNGLNLSPRNKKGNPLPPGK